MIPKLKRQNAVWYLAHGARIDGPPPSVWGDLSGIRGNLTGVRGDLSGIRGDLSGVRGDLSGIRGDLTGVWGDLTSVRGDLSGVWGDLDECQISREEREAGINIKDLIAPN